jgi:hypothetical protein
MDKPIHFKPSTQRTSPRNTGGRTERGSQTNIERRGQRTPSPPNFSNLVRTASPTRDRRAKPRDNGNDRSGGNARRGGVPWLEVHRAGLIPEETWQKHGKEMNIKGKKVRAMCEIM